MTPASVSIPLKLFSEDDRSLLVRKRDGEVKLGERVGIPLGAKIEEIFAGSSARYVLLGIPEDVGVRGNGGVGGAHTAWDPALRAVLNMQSLPTFNGEELLVLGAMDTSALMALSGQAEPPTLRYLTGILDDAVTPVIEAIVTAGKIPVVVGGGHNNAYPILKGASFALKIALNCINMDAHSDYRGEARHSGNPFRYAKEFTALDRYAVFGLHPEYTAADLFEELRRTPGARVWTFDDLLLTAGRSFEQGLNDAVRFVGGEPFGAELDLDSIGGVLSSAATPIGFSPVQARHYVRVCAHAGARYLHLCEGAALLADGRTDPLIGKLLAYLIHDFISTSLSRE